MVVICRKITAESRLAFFEGLKQFKGNKSEWITQACKIVSIHRNVYWDRLSSEKCDWGPPIPDGGYNKETLFKQAAPKYSKLFATPKDKQGLENCIELPVQTVCFSFLFKSLGLKTCLPDLICIFSHQ